jgi:CCR4-NOT transcription complex subunit 3
MFNKMKNGQVQGANKEKLETDLKKNIKRLQRHRDSIKQYLTNPDVKDKSGLNDMRTAIETEMY